MNLNKKIGNLLDNGLSPKLVSSLTESQINLFYKRLLENKKTEAKEAMTKEVKQSETYKMPVSDMQNDKSVAIPTSTTGKPMTATIKGSTIEFTTNEGEMTEDDFDAEFNAVTTGIDQDKIQEPGSDYPGSDRSKDTLDEKFESKAQQGLFWARCKKCKNENCKWCKMAKEFSDKTTKKDYKKMPEKIHPEKTVKYKKKETKEGYLDNVQKKVTDTYAKKLASFTPGLQWGGFGESLDNVIENYTEPTMKKRDLLKLIENEISKRKSLNEDFYFGEEMDEDFDIFANEPAIKEPATKPKTPTEKPKEKPRRKPERITPYENPETRPQGKEEEFDLDMMFMNNPAIKEPAPKTKPTPKTPEREKPRRKPSRETPFENPETRPQGKEEFDFVMERLYNRLSKKK
jgi:hypothetical protein